MTAPRNATELTQALLHDLFDYDPEIGTFRRRVVRGGRPAGAPVGVLHKDGYLSVKIDKRQHAAHRLAWLYIYGCLPTGQLDHISGHRSDNRIANLRECNNSENQQNRKLNKNSTSGYMGVHFDSGTGKYRAHICHAGKQRHLGTFPTPELAHAAYLAAKTVHHPFQPVPREAA